MFIFILTHQMILSFFVNLNLFCWDNLKGSRVINLLWSNLTEFLKGSLQEPNLRDVLFCSRLRPLCDLPLPELQQLQMSAMSHQH